MDNEKEKAKIVYEIEDSNNQLPDSEFKEQVRKILTEKYADILEKRNKRNSNDLFSGFLSKKQSDDKIKTLLINTINSNPQIAETSKKQLSEIYFNQSSKTLIRTTLEAKFNNENKEKIGRELWKDGMVYLILPKGKSNIESILEEIIQETGVYKMSPEQLPKIAEYVRMHDVNEFAKNHPKCNISNTQDLESPVNFCFSFMGDPYKSASFHKVLFYNLYCLKQSSLPLNFIQFSKKFEKKKKLSYPIGILLQYLCLIRSKTNLLGEIQLIDINHERFKELFYNIDEWNKSDSELENLLIEILNIKSIKSEKPAKYIFRKLVIGLNKTSLNLLQNKNNTELLEQLKDYDINEINQIIEKIIKEVENKGYKRDEAIKILKDGSFGEIENIPDKFSNESNNKNQVSKLDVKHTKDEINTLLNKNKELKKQLDEL